MPKRRKGEKKGKYVSRCMGNKEMKSKFPKQKQRAAVCYSYAEEGRRMTFKDFLVEASRFPTLSGPKW